jgi:transposase InsO family protein
VKQIYRKITAMVVVPQADSGCQFPAHFKHYRRTRREFSIFRVGSPRAETVERYNRTIRYDWLSHYLFESIAEVQDFATRWLWTYNNERPNMALGGITPKQKVAMAA